MFRLRSVTVLSDIAVIFLRSIAVYKNYQIIETYGKTWADYKTEIAQKLNTVWYATTKDATTNECYNEQLSSIKSGCYNENIQQRKRRYTIGRRSTRVRVTCLIFTLCFIVGKECS